MRPTCSKYWILSSSEPIFRLQMNSQLPNFWVDIFELKVRFSLVPLIMLNWSRKNMYVKYLRKLNLFPFKCYLPEPLIQKRKGLTMNLVKRSRKPFKSKCLLTFSSESTTLLPFFRQVCCWQIAETLQWYVYTVQFTVHGYPYFSGCVADTFRREKRKFTFLGWIL